MLTILKFLVSGSLLAFLLIAIDWRVAVRAIENLDPLYISLALVILLAQFPIAAWKWQISLAIHGLKWPIESLIRTGIIGFFLNNFFPTAIGGDIYRVYRTTPTNGQISGAISATLLDRLIGLLVMLVIAAIGAGLVYFRQPDQRLLLLILAFSTPPVFVVILPTMVRIPMVSRIISKLTQLPKLATLMLNLKLIVGEKRKLSHLIYVSFAFQGLAVVVIALLFSAVSIHDVLAESAVIGAASSLVSLLPISINGIGVMEGSFAFTAKEFGVDFESAVLVSLILRLSTVLFSIFGAVAFLIDKGRAADLAAVRAMKESAD